MSESEIISDDGQNVTVSGIAECPWCGPKDAGRSPYVQVGPKWSGGMVDARVVCPVCHVSTSRVSVERTEKFVGGEWADVTREIAVRSTILTSRPFSNGLSKIPL